MRTHYENGDAVRLADCACDGCNPSMIKGTLSHERACPDAWRHALTHCKWCGARFFPEYFCQACCDESCRLAYYGFDIGKP
jgi:hypothetical protein